MTTLLITLAAITAVGAAIRSTWSPCGLSMLSTITPMAERSRGRRWGSTAGWFVLGAVAGGATLGLLAAVGATLMSLVDLSLAVTLAIAAVLAITASAMDLGIRTEMPHHRRQVDEVWLDQYRSWVYGLGFGWQIGSGVATYIMTAAVYLTLALAALTADPAVALGICVLFGLTRGLAIFLGVRLTTPDRLRSFHRRFDRTGPAVRRAVIGLQMLMAVVAGAAAGGPIGAFAVLTVVTVLAVTTRASLTRTTSETTIPVRV